MPHALNDLTDDGFRQCAAENDRLRIENVFQHRNHGRQMGRGLVDPLHHDRMAGLEQGFEIVKLRIGNTDVPKFFLQHVSGGVSFETPSLPAGGAKPALR